MEAQKTPTMLEESLLAFVHLAGTDSKPVRVAPTTLIREVIRLAGIETEAGLVILVGECVTELEVDGIDDEHTPACIDDPVHKHGHGRHIHVHCHTCHRIEVKVQYEGRIVERKFSPARTVAQVRRWALHALKLKDAATDKLVLEICDTDTRPRPEEHLSHLETGRKCEICFTLQAAVAPQG